MTAVQSVAHIKLVASPVNAEPFTDQAARLIAVEGRRALIFSPDPKRMFSFAIDGEPVAPSRTTIQGEAGLRGLNLLRNPSFSSPEIPWRVIEGKATRIDRDIADQWVLADGHTAYLTTDAEAEVSIAYIDESGSNLIPAIGGARYGFQGLFGLHRCDALMRIEALRADGRVVATTEQIIEKRLGGRAIKDYSAAAASLKLPRAAAYLRLTLVLTPRRGQNAAAHLFFTNLWFGLPSTHPPLWRNASLTPLEAVCVAAGGRLVEALLPPVDQDRGAEISVLADGRPIQGTPVRLDGRTASAFLLHGFDGVILAGRIENMSVPVPLTLLIDGTAVALSEASPDQDGNAEVALRVPDAWLDGLPHDITLIESDTGAPLYLESEVLRSVLTPWATYDGAGRAAFPAEEHALARDRYRALAAHLAALADGAPAGYAKQAARCHAILCGRLLPRDGARLILPQPADPEVTVFVSGVADAGTAWRCAAALIFAAAKVQFETVLLDTAPLDLDSLVEGFGRLPGPGGSASLLSQAAARARGRPVVLFNARCEPTAGWLDTLCEAFDTFEGVGAAGPKLITPDGRLAEAGRVVWSSGLVEPVTFGGNVRDPRAAYARQVDMLSVDALMLEPNALDALASSEMPGDPLFPDAAGIAFGLARAGRKVVYVPEAVVALGALDSAGASAGHTLAANQPNAAFRRRWYDSYRHKFPEGTSVALAADHNIAGRILFLDLQLPRPDVDAGSYAADQEIRLFQALGFKVTMLPLNMAHLGTYAGALQRRGVEVIHAPFVASLEAALASRADNFDVIYMTRYNVARVALPLLRRYQPRAKRILNVADLHFLRELRTGLASSNADAVNRSRVTRETELGLMREVDLTLTYSDVEAAIILSHHLGRAKVGRLPWVATPSPTVPSFAQRQHIAFLGSFGHGPNVEAMVGFVRDVMPSLRARLPEIELHIFGSQMTDEIAQLAGDRVVVRGHAATVADVHDNVRVFVAPLMSGAGIKGKVLGAMGHGCPTVLSPIAAEGIGGRVGTDYVLADSPTEWVDGIAALIEDETRWNAVSASARDLVATTYGFERGVKALRRALECIEIFIPETSQALCGR